MDAQTNLTTSGDSNFISSPSLKTWFQTQIQSLYGIPSQTDSRNLPQVFFSSGAQILLNHVPVTLEDFQSDIQSQLQSSRQTSISWKDVIEVYSSGADSQNETGIVAGIYIVTRSLNFRIRAGPAQRKTTVVFTAKIHRDPTIHDEDARRIVYLRQTLVDEAVPVHIHGIGGQQVIP
ncbi:hypothetical protein E4T56_gene13474 [Termitomyces sp. T112]|nr:hypothetical protein E4T56_gene13474 [Termitomyces sp. T112]